MITEDYVSYETAKLLQEKGVEGDCEYTGWIGESGSHYFPDDTYLDDDEMIAAQKDRKEFVPLISLQMAMKWLREKEIFVEVTHTLFSSPHKYQYSIFRTEPEFYTTGDEHKSYEEACEAAIKYCLENLI